MTPKKAYLNVDEWLSEIENFSARWERMVGCHDIEKWVREAWKQATRTSRIQEAILLGEIRKLRQLLQELELKMSQDVNNEEEE